ncbi:type IV secretion system protein [Lysobacter sp. BMK333-48F3]|uniref:type IV secretion system protein n=1 Tax=Lysobacter sp. BMK333-48F3 TaxID=2867962 RepID=UPI0021029D63|nr:type IV secretion system protein [Lysobacter sp. BMK333-48F3]
MTDWLSPSIDSAGDFIFFRLILKYLRKEIEKFGIEILGNAMQWAGGIALTLLTLWIMIQGYRIATGQSRDSMMALVTNSLRATLIVGVATTMAMFGTPMHQFLTKDVKKEIHWVITGEDTDPESEIDKNLGYMQLAWSSIDMLDAMDDNVLDAKKTRAMWFVGVGAGGPAVTAGISLLLYEIAMALFVGFGPIFILCLLFDQTKQLFSKWLFYGIGTMFSMAVLSAMISISLKMVTKVALALWGTAIAGALTGLDTSDGMSSQALQQGGLGLILSVLIISAPPMAAVFFQGVMGQFSTFNSFGGGQASPGAGQPPSHNRGYEGGGYGGGYAPQTQNTREVGSADRASSFSGGSPSNTHATGTYNNAGPAHSDTMKVDTRRARE